MFSWIFSRALVTTQRNAWHACRMERKQMSLKITWTFSHETLQDTHANLARKIR